MFAKIVVGTACAISGTLAVWIAGLGAILLVEAITGYDALAAFDRDAAELAEHLTILGYGVVTCALIAAGYWLTRSR